MKRSISFWSCQLFLTGSALLTACQLGMGAGQLAPATPAPSVVPTPAPGAGPGNPGIELVLTTSSSAVCLGEELTLSLRRSNLSAGSLPIVFQVRRPYIPNDQEEIKPVRDTPTDPVVLGQLEVSSQGTGQLIVRLEQTYQNQSGKQVQLKAEDRLAFYAEIAESEYLPVNDVRFCPAVTSSAGSSSDKNVAPQPSSP